MATYFKFSNPATVVLLIAVGFVLFRRRLYRELPWFTTYVVYVAAYTVTAYYVVGRLSNDPSVRFYSYWVGNLITQFLAFIVIIEVFRLYVRGYDSIRKIGITILVAIGILAILVAVLLAPFGSEFDKGVALLKMARSMLVLQRSIRVVQVGLLLAAFALSSYLALSWRNHIFGIALGYGLYASVNLATSVVWEYLGARKNLPAGEFVTLIDGLAYKITLILWIIYLYRADRGLANHVPPAGGDDNLEDWSNVLKPLAK